mgnify:CR=1 FL=1
MLRAAGVDTPEVDARLLAAWLLDVAPLAVNSTEPAPNFQVRFAEAIRRRAAREPLQHITGRAPFGPLELAVGPGVFIPRPETEILADWAVRRLNGASAPVVVDLGTGSGALAIYIAHARDDARVTAVEASATARRYARANAERLGVNVDVVAGDMTDPALLSDPTEAALLAILGELPRVVEQAVEHLVVAGAAHPEQLLDRLLLRAVVLPPVALELEDLEVALGQAFALAVDASGEVGGCRHSAAPGVTGGWTGAARPTG